METNLMDEVRKKFGGTKWGDLASFAKIDNQLTENNQLSVRYFFDNFTNDPTFNEGNIVSYRNPTLGSKVRIQNVMGSWQRTLTSRLLNEFRVGFKPGLKFAAQAADVYFKGFAEEGAVVFFAPHILVKFLLGDGPTRISHEIFEQGELFGRKLQRLALPPGFVPD